MLKVHEIFESIQGQGEYVGYPMLFIRLYGCNRECAYCDTPQDTFKEMSIKQIVQKVEKSKMKDICITGGEPTTQEDLRKLLKALRYTDKYVHIFTNGYDFSVLNIKASNVSIRWDIKDFNSISTLKFPKEMDKLYYCSFSVSFTLTCKDDYYLLAEAFKINKEFFSFFNKIEIGVEDESGLSKWLVKKITKSKLDISRVIFGSRLHKTIGIC